ncbi:MAG: peroxide stress protein YaaA [Pseudomonadota bacterium]
MLTVISPAKSLDMTPQTQFEETVPAFSKEAMSLARTARNLTLTQLRGLMDISQDLARLNAERFKSFDADPTPDRTKAAALIFAGDTYTGLEAASLDEDEMAYAQDHLRILSGLYGLLRPLDAIQPYRLEMGSRLKTRRGKSLYDYWGTDLAKALNTQAQAAGSDILLNCASQEYFGAVAPKALKLRVITPTFLEDRPGGAKIISFFAKRARGAMARFVVQNRIKEAEGLRDFTLGGYAFDADRSTPDAPVFLRPEAASQPLKAAS